MDPKSLTKDFKEFLQCLNAHGVKYLVIGGNAVAFHGHQDQQASGRNKDLADLDHLL